MEILWGFKSPLQLCCDYCNCEKLWLLRNCRLYKTPYEFFTLYLPTKDIFLREITAVNGMLKLAEITIFLVGLHVPMLFCGIFNPDYTNQLGCEITVGLLDKLVKSLRSLASHHLHGRAACFFKGKKSPSLKIKNPHPQASFWLFQIPVPLHYEILVCYSTVLVELRHCIGVPLWLRLSCWTLAMLHGSSARCCPASELWLVGWLVFHRGGCDSAVAPIRFFCINDISSQGPKDQWITIFHPWRAL